MIFKIECPGCKKKYDVHNSFSAKQVACDCGAKFTLPAAPPEGNYQVCPACRELSSNDNVICTSCGFNFKTGGKSAARKKIRDDDEPGFWFKYGILIKKLVMLSILLLVGFTVYHYYTARPFGISAKSPLGKFPVVNAFLGQLNFEFKELPAPAQYPDCKMYCFNNAKAAKDTRGMVDEEIMMIADKSGIIQAFFGHYSVPDVALSPNGTIVSRFFGRLRTEFGVPEKPEFKVVTHGTGRLSWSENVCNWGDQSISIYWTRTDNAIGLVSSSQKIAITLAKYSPEKTLKDSMRGGDEESEPAAGISPGIGGNAFKNISKGINKTVNKKQQELEKEQQ
ncbi:MAG: hypothetical protein WC721_09835 [Victivallaceae bacterium]|jgi:hypothetical protein